MENSTNMVDMGSNASSKRYSFSLFDGHLGAEAAKFCTQHLHEYVAQIMNECDDKNNNKMGDILRSAFNRTDEKFAEYAVANECEAGAVGVYVYYEYNLNAHGKEENFVYVANVGDCRAILCCNGKCNVLTVDHNPKNPEEQKRCGDAIQGDLLSGQVSVTRAIGDYVGGSDKLKGLSCEPNVVRHQLRKEDEFMIIACDGLWDVIGNDIAMKHCRRSLRKHNDVDQAAKDLIKLAQCESMRNCHGEAEEALTSDNISVMVVGFADENGVIVPQIKDNLPRPRRRLFGRGFKKKTSAQ